MEMVPEQELNGIKLSRQVATLRIFFSFFYRSTQRHKGQTRCLVDRRGREGALDGGKGLV